MDTLRDMESFVSKSSFCGNNPYLESVLRTYKVEAEYSLNGPLHSNYHRHNENSTSNMPRLPNRLVLSVNGNQTIADTEKSLRNCVPNDKVRNGSRSYNYNQMSDNDHHCFGERIQRTNVMDTSKINSTPCRLTQSNRVHSVPKYKPSDSSVKLESGDSDKALKDKITVDVGPCVGPVLVPADQTIVELSETKVEGHPICGFSVGGEMRLCLPQIINIILDKFSVDEIRPIYDELHVFCALCTKPQLDILKRAGVLPMGAPSCGLITKTDAERLCAKLLRQSGASQDTVNLKMNDFKRNLHVLHECFGKCFGVFCTTDYGGENSNAISCLECGHDFTPAQFVCHSHALQENRIVHWGFDSARWRNYIMINEEYYEGNDSHDGKGLALEVAEKILKDMKSKSSPSDFRKRPMDNAIDERDRDEVSPVKRLKEEPVTVCGDREDIGCSGTVKYGNTAGDLKIENVERSAQHYSTADKKMRESERRFEPNVSLPVSSLDLSTGTRRRTTSDVSLQKSGSYEEKIEVKTPLPIGLEAKLNAILSAELAVFKTALLTPRAEDQSPTEAGKDEALREFVSLQQTDLELMSDLLLTYRKQQQELKYMYRLLMDTQSGVKNETVDRDRQMLELKVAHERKLSEADGEIARLRQEIDSMISGNKRSDVGLMKAKYKAQAEHFRRKIQSAEQLNDDLRKELTDARSRVPGVRADFVPHRAGLAPSIIGGLAPPLSSSSRLSMSSDIRGSAHDKEEERVRRYTLCMS